jgi:uncharacterized protein (DUF1501 family)
MKRRNVLKAATGIAGLSWMPWAAAVNEARSRVPILVAVELSGGNDGLNSVVPYADDAYYRHRPTVGIAADQLLKLDEYYGFNPGMLGLHRLWQDGCVAIVHGCGYARPSFSHFTSMAYWHTGAPHGGDEYGWMGRVADAMHQTRRDNMIINVGANQSLAVKSAHHTPVVFDDPERFQRNQWLQTSAVQPAMTVAAPTDNPARAFLNAVNRSAQASSAQIRQAWSEYRTPVDYGIAPMDLDKVAACIDAGLDTQLYHVSFRNNSFDTHVQQPALHRRLLSYACDGIHGFIRDLQRLGHADRVVVMVYSEFGRRVPENANLGTDHGSANVMFMIGEAVKGGHYGEAPSLTALVDGDNLAYTTDFRRVYATAIQGWLGVPATQVLHGQFEPFDLFI